jgi:2-keto-4-pentenoate hydratase/2-oxohepta-3-ene-1,7-dioic acid hydratase in catechol pathway
MLGPRLIEEGKEMKYIRYRYQGKTSYGILDGNAVREIRGGLFGDREKTGCTANLGDIELLYPCEPSKILAVGLNYGSHLESHAPGRKAPEHPEIFLKPVSAMLACGGKIQIPLGAHSVHYEGELAVVIGKTIRCATASEAADSIFGFTCGNDISERYWQKNDLQWWRAKGCDTFAPLGPAIATGFDWRQGRIETRINGAIAQSGQFNELLFDPPAIIRFASQYVTLMPGDVIYTGTPGSTNALRAGDLVEVEIPGIGILRNTVAGSE